MAKKLKKAGKAKVSVTPYDAFQRKQKLPLGYFQHNKTGDLMSRLTIDVQAVRELLGFGSLASIDAMVCALEWCSSL